MKVILKGNTRVMWEMLGPREWMAIVLILLLVAGGVMAQLQPSNNNVIVTNTVTVAGNKSNNGGAPGATNLGVLPGVATAAAPVYVEGNQVAASLDLAGNTRVSATFSASATIRTAPITSCSPGTTAVDATATDVAIGAGTDILVVTTCVTSIYVNNKTASACTITIADRAGGPFNYVTTFSVPGNSDVTRQFFGKSFTTGVKLTAGTAACLNAALTGYQ